MSVGKRHLHVNGSMVTKVSLSGTRRGGVNEARSSGGKKRTDARWKKNQCSIERKRRYRFVSIQTFVCR